MLSLILNFLSGGLLKAWEAKLKADGDTNKLVADAAIADIKAQLEAKRLQAQTVQTGMQSKAFWIPWLMAAVPTALWYGWGMLDSTIYGGTLLPDVAALPPQLKQYADAVWDNLFVSGAIVGSAATLASAIRGRR